MMGSLIGLKFSGIDPLWREVPEKKNGDAHIYRRTGCYDREEKGAEIMGWGASDSNKSLRSSQEELNISPDTM